MKVTYNWLKQYVEFDWSAGELADRLTMLGLEVEGIDALGGEFEGVVIGKVVSRESHPNADRLSVCRVEDGTGVRQIVCGATNFQPGDKVPLILPGNCLPAAPGEKPFRIEVGKLRGVESHGMLCSGKELGLTDDAAGLMILDPDAPVGVSLAAYLSREEPDTLYDLEITPNRPDWNSVIGIAREIAALTGNPLRLPQPDLPESDQPPAANHVEVRIEAADLCPRYTARVMRGTTIGPSPQWLRNTLAKVGLRSINNVVDITNFVMLETGQPLHAFDYHLLAASHGEKPAIIVRRAREGETFTTLDEQEHVLTPDMLVIADTDKAVALAGIMGGLNSEIKDTTTDILLESAYFSPSNIRRTAKHLGLHTDSSYRFERGADIGIPEYASQRAAQLILESTGGHCTPGVVDAFPQPPQPTSLTLRFQKTNQLLGIEIPAANQIHYLNALELPLAHEAGADRAEFTIPSFRVDLKREADLIEEIARLHGVDQIPATAPRGVIGFNAYDDIHDEHAEVRRLLTGMGLSEAQGQTLIASSKADLAAAEAIPLAHPLSADMDVLRPSLLPGLLDALRHNLSHRIETVPLFELGRVFLPPADSPGEERRLAIALTGNRYAAFWEGPERNATCDIFDLKGILEEFFDHFGVREILFQSVPEPSPLFLESAELRQDHLTFGCIGQMQPVLARQYDLRDPVFLAELNLDLLVGQRSRQRQYASIPAFPAVRRDVALLVDESVTHDDILTTLAKSRAKNLERIELFDLFRGQNIPAGQKSMAYAFTYRSPDKTLTDKEVDKAHRQVVDRLTRELHAAVR